MTIRIADYPVALGDRLYSRRAAAWGNVVQVLDNGVVLEIIKGDTRRTYTVTEGGVVAGVQDVAWHTPLDLSLPKAQLWKLSKLQRILDTANEVL